MKVSISVLLGTTTGEFSQTDMIASSFFPHLLEKMRDDAIKFQESMSDVEKECYPIYRKYEIVEVSVI